VCVIQPDSSAVQGVETLEHSVLDLTRVNHLLAVLSHKKQQLEQVVAAFVYFSDATLSFTQFHISWQIWSVERGDTVGRVGVVRGKRRHCGEGRCGPWKEATLWGG